METDHVQSRTVAASFYPLLPRWKNLPGVFLSTCFRPAPTCFSAWGIPKQHVLPPKLPQWLGEVAVLRSRPPTPEGSSRPSTPPVRPSLPGRTELVDVPVSCLLPWRPQGSPAIHLILLPVNRSWAFFPRPPALSFQFHSVPEPHSEGLHLPQDTGAGRK
jgi:hypothetical protein